MLVTVWDMQGWTNHWSPWPHGVHGLVEETDTTMPTNYLIRVMRTIKQNPVPRRHCKSKGRSSSPSIATPKVSSSETVVHTKVQKRETAAEIPCAQHYSKHMWSWPQPRPSLPLLSSAKCHVSSLATHVFGCNIWRVIISPILAPLEDPGEGVFLKHLFFLIRKYIFPRASQQTSPAHFTDETSEARRGVGHAAKKRKADPGC